MKEKEAKEKELVVKACAELKAGARSEWAIFFELNHCERLPPPVRGFVEHAFMCGFHGGGMTLTKMYEEWRKEGDGKKKMIDNEFASNYPLEEKMKKKKIVSEIKEAGKFARSTFNPGTGVGKSSEAISPGKKKKKK